MASRKRIVPRLVSPRRKRRSTLPQMEGLEPRIVLSNTLPPNLAATEASGLYPTETQVGLVPYKLASGGTAWLQMPGATGVLATEGSLGTTKPFDPGVILGGLPAASP